MYPGVGLLISLARPGHAVGRLLLAGAGIWGVGEGVLAVAVHGLMTEPGSVPAAAWLAILGTFLRGAGWLILVLAVPLVFPDGRPPSRPWRVGAGGYVLKGAGQAELVGAIRTVSAGGAVLRAGIARRVLGGQHEASSRLTEREAEILALIANGRSNPGDRPRAGREPEDGAEPRLARLAKMQVRDSTQAALRMRGLDRG